MAVHLLIIHFHSCLLIGLCRVISNNSSLDLSITDLHAKMLCYTAIEISNCMTIVSVHRCCWIHCIAYQQYIAKKEKGLTWLTYDINSSWCNNVVACIIAMLLICRVAVLASLLILQSKRIKFLISRIYVPCFEIYRTLSSLNICSCSYSH